MKLDCTRFIHTWTLVSVSSFLWFDVILRKRLYFYFSVISFIQTFKRKKPTFLCVILISHFSNAFESVCLDCLFRISSLPQLLSIPSSYYVCVDCFQRLLNLDVTVVNLSYRVELDLTLSFTIQVNLVDLFHTHYPSIDIYTTVQIKSCLGECFS